jgi:hypothetical protein
MFSQIGLLPTVDDRQCGYIFYKGKTLKFFLSLPPNSFRKRINGSLFFSFFAFFQIFQDSEKPSARHPLLQDWFLFISFLQLFFFLLFKNFITEK